jgi:LmbE family N-acetylglucosaminyl deacetylase
MRPRGIAAAVAAGAAIVTVAGLLVPAPAFAASCEGGAMQIVAHQDDDLLFQSPDVLHDVQAGRCVRTVFVTAGDAAQDADYWLGREAGSRAAYAEMAGVADTWTTSELEVDARPIRVQTLTAASRISLVFMRLPDGNRQGTGMIRHHHESLMRLWQSSVTSITAVDGSASYIDSSLRTTLTALMVDFAPTTVRTEDWTAEFGKGDNADHIATALYVRAAQRDYAAAHTLLGYGGYPTWTRPPNVAGTDLFAKQSAFETYAVDDSRMCLRPWCPGSLVASIRLARQYVVGSESSGNSARRPGVTVTASSQNRRAGQTAPQAVDGLALGYPRNPAEEWATVRGHEGSWIQLDFPAPTVVNGVVLADRPNLSDQVTGATLLFSDGTTVAIGALANNGSSGSFRFASRTTTSVRVTITSVSGSTQNAGLAELETYATMP